MNAKTLEIKMLLTGVGEFEAAFKQALSSVSESQSQIEGVNNNIKQ